MDCHVDVGGKTVVLNTIGRWCATLVAPDNWVQFYHWDEMTKGLKAPYPMSGHAMETFDDPAVVQFAVDAWKAAAPPEQPDLAGEDPLVPVPPLDPPPPPEPEPPIDP